MLIYLQSIETEAGETRFERLYHQYRGLMFHVAMMLLADPRDAEDAAHMIRFLQGRTHTVASGLAIWYRGRTVTSHELTGVTFAPMTPAEIQAYVATGESFGKAGGYAIQGHAARYITGIQGDYFNVVGLPVRRLYETLKLVFGIHL